jgi:glycosyltransferase involved in cell wall biosynthesis
LCITELDVGGAERCLAELALRLDRRQFSVVVYSLGSPATDDGRSLVPKLKAAGLEVHCLGGRRASDAPRTTRKLARLLKSQQAEILQSFLFHANFIGRIAARWAGVPQVVSGIRVAERQARWHLRLDRWTARFVEAYVAVSESVAEFSRREGGLPQEKLTVIPNGVDVGLFDAASPIDLSELGIVADRRTVIYVGRLEPQKGLREFISRSRDWLDPLPGHDLLLVGEGPQRGELEDLVRRLGLAERIRFAGWRGDVPEILRASEIMVLPSRWEGMPNVLLEAMACRLPVVAMNVEGVAEALGPENLAAQTVPPGDLHVFAEKLRAIASSGELASRLGAENRRRVEQQFTLDRMVAAYAALFQRLVRR